MQPVYEIIKTQSNSSINMFLHKVHFFHLHWHSNYEFLLVLDGKTTITVGEEKYECKDNDIILINPYEVHSIYSDDGVVMLALQLNNNIFKHGLKFNVNQSLYPNQEYSTIKHIMARIIKIFNEAAPNNEYLINSLINYLQYELLNKYLIIQAENQESDFKHFSKLNDILNYIQENYQKDISLAGVAELFYYSPSYLSRIFEKNVGTTFKKYINNLRLAKAVDLLLTTKESIDEIAIESGFPNSRSFVSLHKETYGSIPSEYRKTHQTKYEFSEEGFGNYQDFKKTKYLSKLAKYLVNDLPTEKSDFKPTEYVNSLINTEITVGKLKHNFKKFCSVGRASDLLRQNIRNMIIEMQNEIGFEYIKFHGLFDDDLSVYVKTSDGRIVINFDAIDNIIDFLLSTRLKPLIQLSFMPKDLAKYPNKTTFFRPIITSEPTSNEEWVSFVKKFVSHLLSRYGQEVVEKWPFCVWNEPESPKSLFGFEDPTLFKQFYQDTYQAVKEICPSIQFGNSSMMTHTIFKTTYFEETFLSDKRFIPDFINFHFYPLTHSEFIQENLSKPSVELSSNPYIMRDTIKTLKEKINSLGLSNVPIYLTEWNSTTSHRDLLNDTAFKGAYVVRNIIDNYDDIDSFGYWTLTDDILELPLEDKLFHGGIGLYTKSGIKKPPYYGFQFLSQLGDKLLEKNKGYIITEDIRGFQMVLVNYIHISDLYSAGELFDASRSNRYAAFRNERFLDFNFILDHVVTGDYIIEEYIVNRENGSCYDIWDQRYNNEEPTTTSSMNALKAASNPKYCVRRKHVSDGKLIINATLLPHEIRLIKIKRL